jgi:hypothetical protein
MMTVQKDLRSSFGGIGECFFFKKGEEPAKHGDSPAEPPCNSGGVGERLLARRR